MCIQKVELPLQLNKQIMQQESSVFDGLRGFHPVFQCTVILVIGAVICFLIYQMWKTVRES